MEEDEGEIVPIYAGKRRRKVLNGKVSPTPTIAKETKITKIVHSDSTDAAKLYENQKLQQTVSNVRSKLTKKAVEKHKGRAIQKMKKKREFDCAKTKSGMAINNRIGRGVSLEQAKKSQEATWQRHLSRVNSTKTKDKSI